MNPRATEWWWLSQKRRRGFCWKEESHGLEKQGLKFRHKKAEGATSEYQAKLLNVSMLLEGSKERSVDLKV